MKYEVSFWRVPAPQVKAGRYLSVIEDRGVLKKAVADSHSNYLFSETGAGVQPLAIIGTRMEIAAYLMGIKGRKLVNSIAELPDIYMGVSPYVVGERFRGLFPAQDFGTQLFTQLVKFFPDVAQLKLPPFVEAAGLPGDAKELLGVLEKFNQQQGEQLGGVVYVKFGYLPEEKMTRIGRKEVSLAAVLNLLAVGNRK
ncbi:MAG: hypothetical protein AAGC84_04745 [Pseudomonas sp.]